jgi:hypothetical protein
MKRALKITSLTYFLISVLFISLVIYLTIEFLTVTNTIQKLEIQGTVNQVTDLYTYYSSGAQSGYYLHAREVLVDQQRFLVPYTSNNNSINQIEQGHQVIIQYNQDNEVLHVSIP